MATQAKAIEGPGTVDVIAGINRLLVLVNPDLKLPERTDGTNLLEWLNDRLTLAEAMMGDGNAAAADGLPPGAAAMADPALRRRQSSAAKSEAMKKLQRLKHVDVMLGRTRRR